MAVYQFTKDSTPPMPGSDLDRPRRLASAEAAFTEALTSGDAWRRFCDGLRSAGDSILGSPDAASPTDLAEGYQYLLGLVHSLLEGELYRTDATSPAFLRVQTDVVKVGMDNPDAALMSAPLSDDGTFEIYGTVGRIRLLELMISGGGRPEMHYLDEFAVGPGGEFRVTLARDKQPGNWIQLRPGARSVLIRRAAYDWDSEEVPHLAIRRLDGEAGVLPWCLRTPTAAEVGEQLDALGQLVAKNADYWVDMVHSFRDEGDNVIPAPRPLPATGMNSARSSVKGFFSVPEDQALVIEFTPPEGVFWSISVGDMWYRTIDFSHHQTSLNGHQVELDPDGVCRVLVAHRDPGVPNWLDTVGHERGVMIIRWVMVSHRPQPEVRLVPFAEIGSSIHPQTRRVSPQERAEKISRRRDAVAKRLAVPVTTRWSYSTRDIDPPRP
jgi:Protein of unknown function (DUF1214)